MDKSIKIIVAGGTATGKSTILYLLKNFLKGYGFKIEYVPTMDHEDESQFDGDSSRHLDEKIEAIKAKNVKLVMVENQTYTPAKTKEE